MKCAVLLASVVAVSMAHAAEGLEGAVPTTMDGLTERSLVGASGGRDVLGFTFFWENDGAWSNAVDPDDSWYTAGVATAFQWQGATPDRIVGALPSIGGEFSPAREGTSYSVGALLAMNMFTPQEITDPEIREDDRPYAGWSYLGLIAQRANRAATVPTFEHLELDLGMLGPSSGAEDAQKWAHHTFGGDYPEGWEYQVDDEFGVDFNYHRRWRVDVTDPDRLSGGALQIIPDVQVTLGTVHTHLSSGVTFRYGWRLPDDFGPGNMRIADDFTRPMGSEDGLQRGVAGYFYVRPGVRLVAHDATLGDSLYQRNLVSVDHEWFVGQFTAGVAVTFLKHWRAGYAFTLSSPEFKEQESWHSFASINVSAVFTW